MKLLQINKIRFFFSLFFLFIWGQGAWGLDISEFYNCDELFCPNKDGSNDKASVDDLALRIGFEKMDKNIKFHIPFRQSQRTGKSSEFTTADHQDTDSSLGSEGDSPQVGDNPYDPQSSPQVQASGYGPGSSGAGGGSSRQMGHSRSFSGLSRSGVSKAGSSSIKGSLSGVGQSGDIRTRGGGRSYTNLALLNRRNRGVPGGGVSKGGGNDQSGSTPGFGSSGSGGLSSGGGSPSHLGEKTKKKKGLLSKLAGKLGLGHYFGSGKRRNSGNFRSRRNYHRGKIKTAKKSQRDGRLKSPEDIIRESFRKNLRRRNLANSLEFEGSQTSLFQKICEHYDSYARSQNIPDNRKHCPRD